MTQLVHIKGVRDQLHARLEVALQIPSHPLQHGRVLNGLSDQVAAVATAPETVKDQFVAPPVAAAEVDTVGANLGRHHVLQDHFGLELGKRTAIPVGKNFVHGGIQFHIVLKGGFAEKGDRSPRNIGSCEIGKFESMV